MKVSIVGDLRIKAEDLKRKHSFQMECMRHFIHSDDYHEKRACLKMFAISPLPFMKLNISTFMAYMGNAELLKMTLKAGFD